MQHRRRYVLQINHADRHRSCADMPLAYGAGQIGRVAQHYEQGEA